MSYDPVQEAKQNLAARESARALYNSNSYQLEKVTGKRTETGALKLKRLKPKHRQIIAMHLKGHSNRDIAFIMDMDEVTISRVLHDPLATELIAQHAAGVQKELEALLPLAVDATRSGLQHDDMKHRLKASDQVYRALGKYHHGDEGQGKYTAEDVIAKAFEAIGNQAGAIKELARPVRPTAALDVSFEEVKDGGRNSNSKQDLQRLPPVEVGNSDSQ